MLDTLESVQWNAAAVRRLAEFVDELRARGLAELRVVASGRADIPELRVWEGSDLAYESSALAPLAVDEATELATSLGPINHRVRVVAALVQDDCGGAAR